MQKKTWRQTCDYRNTCGKQDATNHLGHTDLQRTVQVTQCTKIWQKNKEDGQYSTVYTRHGIAGQSRIRCSSVPSNSFKNIHMYCRCGSEAEWKPHVAVPRCFNIGDFVIVVFFLYFEITHKFY